MRTGSGFRLLLISSLLAGCLFGAAGATSIGTDWKERSSGEAPFLGVMITPDASLVYAGGNEMLVRSWDREIHWGYRPARVAALSYDGKRIAMAVGNKLSILNERGIENWSRTMEGYVKTVAISPNGSVIISANEKGDYISWGRDGEFIARLHNQTANAIAIAPATDLVVVATDAGLRFYNHRLELLWCDNRTESRDTFIAIAGDGSTVIVAGANEVASYTRYGTLNWRRQITTNPILDMHCSFDCYTIVVAGQDKTIFALDQSGIVRWKYETEHWINSIGVSRYASVIAAGGIDRAVYVFDRSGNLLTTKKTDNLVQPGSIAVSSDGRRIVVADQSNLYGFSLIGDPVVPDDSETFTRPPLTSVPTTHPTTVPVTTPATTGTTIALPPTTAAVPVKPTTYSPLDPILFLPALGAAFLLCKKMR
jgi:WD40 repeat protein